MENEPKELIRAENVDNFSGGGGDFLSGGGSAHKRSERETGFELLRIASVFLIGCVHVLNYGGMLSNAANGTELLFMRLLYSFFMPSVNVFVLISAYFTAKSRFKIKKIALLWGEVLFFGLVPYAVFLLVTGGKFDVMRFLRYLFPVSGNAFWFFTAYLLTYLASPFLNLILEHAGKKKLILLVAGLSALTWFIHVPLGEVIPLAGGYSLTWFIALYLIGGYLRLYPPSVKKYVPALVYLVCVLSVWGMSYAKRDNLFMQILCNTFDYDQPLVLAESVCLLLMFRGIRIKNQVIHGAICFVSSCTFGIYLFQESALKSVLYFDLLHVGFAYGRPAAAAWTILFALGVFFSGIAADCVRKVLAFVCKKIFAAIKSRIKRRKKEQQADPS